MRTFICPNCGSTDVEVFDKLTIDGVCYWSLGCNVCADNFDEEC